MTPRTTLLFLVAATSLACASPSSPRGRMTLVPVSTAARPARHEPVRIRPEEARARAVRTAARLVGPARSGAPSDATGLIRSCYADAGIALPPSSKGSHGIRALHAWARKQGLLHQRVRPEAGDIAFFHDTHDENGDGKRNDPLTHAAIVERVEQDGTVVLISRVRSGVIRMRMNLQQPAVRRDRKTGRVLNHYLRAGGGRDASRTAAQLFAGFASLTG